MAENEQTAAERQLAIQKIYVKDFSFESPKSPQVFTRTDWSPKTDLNLRSTHTKVGDTIHEVVLTVTAEAKDEDATLFLVELQQAGLFHITGYGDEEFKALIGSFCPNILFPYARENISSVVSKGGFPEFILQPINFDALYAQGLAQAQAQAGADALATAGGDGAGGNGGEPTH
jgi:preprotein translocase subunit SecB